MFVDGRAVLNQRVHIGDSHANFDISPKQGLGDGELIEVPRVIVVNGSPKEVRQVPNPEGIAG